MLKVSLCQREIKVPFTFFTSSINAEIWNSFTNKIAGYTLSYPDELEVDMSRNGKDALFRYDGYPIICINYVDSTEGRKRGLWVKHQPIGNILLSGISGKKYEYTHTFFIKPNQTLNHITKN